MISEVAERLGGRGAAGGTGWPRSATGRWPTWSGRPRSAPGRSSGNGCTPTRRRPPGRPGVSTRWIDSDERLRAAPARPGRRRLRRRRAARRASPRWPTGSRPFGWSNSLSAKLIQLTSPASRMSTRAPSCGTCRWSTRTTGGRWTIRRRRELLAAHRRRLVAGRSTTRAPRSCWSRQRALRLRRDRPELFTGYTPLTAPGRPPSTCLPSTGAARSTVATRLPAGLAAAGGWRDTAAGPARRTVDRRAHRPAVQRPGAGRRRCWTAIRWPCWSET